MYIFIPYARNIVFWKNKHQAPKVVKMRQEYTKVENSKNILNSFLKKFLPKQVLRLRAFTS